MAQSIVKMVDDGNQDETNRSFIDGNALETGV
jgi:hypothetical protein